MIPQLLERNPINITAPVGGSSTSAFISGFNIQGQKQKQWCWAAISASVSRFYDSSSTWTQCKIVEQRPDRDSCCSSPSDRRCNKPDKLNLGLNITGNLNRYNQATMNVAKDTIIDEIENNRPVCLFLSPRSGAVGHFIVVTGYRTTDEGKIWYRIEDPANGGSTSEVSSKALDQGKYKRHGRVTFYYLTEA